MKRLVCALVGALAALLVTKANAGDYRSIKDGPSASCCDANWNGVYAGVAVGYGIGSSTLHDNWLLGRDTYDLGPDGVTGTVTIGFDRTIHDRWVWGLFADYTFGDLDASVALRSQPLGSQQHLSYSDMWAVGGRLGFTQSCCTLWYLTAGYTATSVDFEQGSQDLSGYFLGVGVEQQIRNGFSLKLEYRFSDYEDSRFDFSACCTAIVDVDNQIHSIRLGLAYKFDVHDRLRPYEPLK